MKKEDKETLNEQPKVEETPAEETPVEDAKVEEPINAQPEVEIKEETPAEEKPADENIKEEQPVDDAPIVIDNTVEAPTQPIQDVPRYAKIKEPMSKKKKITILVASIVAFIAVFSILFFPLYFCYFQGRVHIYKAEDFAKVESGKRIVIEKNVVVEGDLDLSQYDCSIDLSGHDLTVEGKLSLGNSVEVGTLKKGEYTSKGILTVGSLNVSGSDFNFASSLIVKDAIQVVANTATFNSIDLVTEAAFTANSITFNAPLSVASEATVVAFENCPSVVFNADNGASTTYFVNSNVVLNNSAKTNKFDLDKTSTLQAYGELSAVSGGNVVAMLKGHTCQSYDGVNVLAIYDAFNDTYTATNCTSLLYLETLPAPADFIVSEEGGVFKAVCAEVEPEDSVRYQFIFDSQKFDITDEPSIDITSALKAAGAATHKLQVYALGNYSFDALKTLAELGVPVSTTLYLDSEEPATLEYSYTLKLSTPTNVEAKVDKDDNVLLSYSPVDFADYYVLTVDGTDKYILTSLSKEAFESSYASVASEYGNKIIQYTLPSLVNIRADITEQVSPLGYHSLRLVAASFSKEIETSKEAMTSYKTTKKITLTDADIVAQSTSNGDGTYTNTITINNCEEGKIFKLVINGTEEVRLSNSRTYTFTSTKSFKGNTVVVTAEAYGFYEAATTSPIIFVEV